MKTKGKIVAECAKYDRNSAVKLAFHFFGVDASVLEEDGGPGSGNWGHKGRPGKIGGSGKGGGKQYRGGRSDVLYTGSRKDWLNGLSGESQKKVTRNLKEIAMIYGDDPGKMNDPEYGLELMMKKMKPDQKTETIGYMEEARNWKQYANRLIQENWTDEDKKIATTLGDKYGVSFVGGTALPDDSDLEYWDKNDLDYWLDLKSKAMGGPTSGKEAPEELQYEAGLKERPSNFDFSWAKGLDTGDLYNASSMLANMIRRPVGPNVLIDGESGTGISLEDMEKQAFTNVVGGFTLLQNRMKAYLRYKMMGSGIPESAYPVPQSMLSRLNEEEQKELEKISRNARLNSGSILNEMDYMDLGERYVAMAIINKALGGADCVPEMKKAQEDYNKKVEEERRVKEEYIKKREEERRKRDEELKRAEEEQERQAKAAQITFAQNREQRQKEYDKATSTSQIASIMERSGLFKVGRTRAVNIPSVDLESAKEVAASYEKVCEQYPFIVGHLAALDETASKNAYASCTMFEGHVHLNPWFYGQHSRMVVQYEDNVKSGYHPKGTDQSSIVTHELGHAIDGYLTEKGINGSTWIKSKTHYFSGILRGSVLKSLKMTKRDIPREVSRYAAKDDQEWFAECLAEAIHSPNPRPMAREMKRQLDEILRKEGLISA